MGCGTFAFRFGFKVLKPQQRLEQLVDRFKVEKSQEDKL